MKPMDCDLEPEVLAVVLQGRWPDRVDAELRGHVAACEICADVVAIAGAVDDAREDTRARAVIPDSGRVWWLAQMRARREASQTAGRPITAAQVLALACAMGILGACFGATSSWFQTTLHQMALSLGTLKSQVLPFAVGLAAGHGLLFLAMTAIVLVVPAAVYLTVLRE
jgi:hypothetical protein